MRQINSSARASTSRDVSLIRPEALRTGHTTTHSADRTKTPQPEDTSDKTKKDAIQNQGFEQQYVNAHT